MAQHVTNVKEELDNEYGMHSPIKRPCLENLKLYQLLIVNDDIDVYLVKAHTTKNKDKFRQMVFTSFRNFASHIGAVVYSNFCPVSEKWKYHKNLGG